MRLSNLVLKWRQLQGTQQQSGTQCQSQQPTLQQMPRQTSQQSKGFPLYPPRPLDEGYEGLDFDEGDEN